MALRERRADANGLPALLVEPESSPAGPPVLWLTHLGGSKEQTLPMLRRFAEAGHAAASFDPPDHGERSRHEDPWVMAAETLAAFRLRMWPLLGRFALESTRVLDWMARELEHPGGFLAGGVSMGGDTAVALAGLDARVQRVAAVGSTPDWARPGMTALEDPGRALDQGQGDSYSRWLRERIDPMCNLERFERTVPIAFECGGEDHHVPTSNARAFKRALGGRGRAAGAGVRVTEHPGLDHLAITRDEAALESCVRWLIG